MFTLGFFVGIALSPFWMSVTLMTHHVKPKTQLKSKNDYSKCWISVKIAVRSLTGRMSFVGIYNLEDQVAV
jgi:hypothetical protein